MADFETTLSDLEAVEQYGLIVEAALVAGGPLTEATRSMLEQRAEELEIHRLDAEQVVASVLARPSVQISFALRTEQHARAQQDLEALRTELLAEQQHRVALTTQLSAEQERRQAFATQMSKMHSLVESLQQRLASFEQAHRTLEASLARVRADHKREVAQLRTEPNARIEALISQLNSERMQREEALAILIHQLGQRLTTVERMSRLPDNAELVWIPAGDFTMGSTEMPNEQPVHTVYLDAYYIYKYPVTVNQYKLFCTATGRQMPVPPDFNSAWSRENHPIVNVSWDNARDYCHWVSGSLPTEAQWEKAARGTDSRRYPWGNGWNTALCINNANSGGSTQPVGSRPGGASPYGVQDMAGNVWEWCADWYDADYYRRSPSGNPPGSEMSNLHAIRGASWNESNVQLFRCACRGMSAPDARYPGSGFRCVVRTDAV